MEIMSYSTKCPLNLKKYTFIFYLNLIDLLKSKLAVRLKKTQKTSGMEDTIDTAEHNTKLVMCLLNSDTFNVICVTLALHLFYCYHMDV